MLVYCDIWWCDYLELGFPGIAAVCWSRVGSWGCDHVGPGAPWPLCLLPHPHYCQLPGSSDRLSYRLVWYLESLVSSLVVNIQPGASHKHLMPSLALPQVRVILVGLHLYYFFFFSEEQNFYRSVQKMLKSESGDVNGWMREDRVGYETVYRLNHTSLVSINYILMDKRKHIQ